jgi:hypothetical protein
LKTKYWKRKMSELWRAEIWPTTSLRWFSPAAKSPGRPMPTAQRARAPGAVTAHGAGVATWSTRACRRHPDGYTNRAASNVQKFDGVGKSEVAESNFCTDFLMSNTNFSVNNANFSVNSVSFSEIRHSRFR